MGNKPKLAVVDYGSGNLHSVGKAFEHVGADVSIVTEPSQIAGADALILPGVGALGDCIEGLKATGFDDTVRGWIGEDRPFFGICLGQQALFDYSEENDTKGLGIFEGPVVRFRLPKEYKIPHMGWNSVTFRGESPLTKDIAEGSQFYFVHSYHIQPADEDIIWGTADYGGEFPCAIRVGNCYATQFHPEKSQATGLQIYASFVQWLSAGAALHAV